jgi:hypothetical protein
MAMPGAAEEEAGRMAALRRFPADRKTIDELILRNGDFRDMCDELAEAEDALAAAEHLPPAVRAERTAEWAASIELLSLEMARALREANVVRVGWAGRPIRRL